MPPSKFANASASLSGRYLSFLNVKRSRCTERKALASVRSPGRPGALRPSFLGNAAGMLQHARAALRVAQPRLNGLRIVRHVGPKRQNCRKTMPYARILKIGFRVRYRTQSLRRPAARRGYSPVWRRPFHTSHRRFPRREHLQRLRSVCVDVWPGPIHPVTSATISIFFRDLKRAANRDSIFGRSRALK